MSGDFIVNQEHRDIGPLDERAKSTLRPVLVAFVVTLVLAGAGVLLSILAPDVFAAVGGWVTVVVLVFLTVVATSVTMLRRMQRLAAAPDESEGTGRP